MILTTVTNSTYIELWVDSFLPNSHSVCQMSYIPKHVHKYTLIMKHIQYLMTVLPRLSTIYHSLMILCSMYPNKGVGHWHTQSAWFRGHGFCWTLQNKWTIIEIALYDHNSYVTLRVYKWSICKMKLAVVDSHIKYT